MLFKNITQVRPKTKYPDQASYSYLQGCLIAYRPETIMQAVIQHFRKRGLPTETLQAALYDLITHRGEYHGL